MKVYDTCGKENTMNKMVSEVNTSYIAILDVDDKWDNTKLEHQLQYINKYDVIGTLCRYFGDSKGYPNIPIGEINSTNFDIYNGNPLINSSVILNKKYAKWYSRFNLDDYDLWIRLWKNKIKFFNINKVLTYHRIHSNSYYNSTSIQDLDGLIKYHINN